MKWFGKHWGAPICDQVEQIETPQEDCYICGVRIQEGDIGVTMPFHGEVETTEVAAHHRCFLEALGLSS